MTKLCIRLENGEELTAPVEQWLAALIHALPDEKRRGLFENIRRQTIFVSTPGNYVLHAEPGHLQLFR